ncbi:MAG TPA: hypothetical protein VFG21_01850 [Xanthomonadaceae bacterium]|nr:hypothetical protein [Xanthomonadaceae bacterium]
MRLTAMLTLLFLMPVAHADSVRGFCQRDGTRLEFTDGIAFADARAADGTITTAIYVTSRPLDRAALAQCAECRAELPEDSFASPRGDLIEAQREATAKGWMEIQHVGGELDMTVIVNIMYLSDDGWMTGIDGGNGRVVFDTRSATRVAGKVVSEAREAPMNETDMLCDVAFDLAVGWPN